MVRRGESTLTISIDELVETTVKDEKIRLLKANIALSSWIRAVYESMIPRVFPTSLSINEARTITEAGMFTICNATDSVIERYSTASPGYVAEIKIKLEFSSRILHYEIEDNGIGIKPEVEDLLFKELIDSPKSGKGYFHGKMGIDLFKFRTIIEERGGEVYFRNKGLNHGAVFGYRLPMK